jgi:glucokinase
MILAADVGGTNARLGLFEIVNGRLQLVAAATYPSRAYASLDDVVERFRSEHPHAVAQACFAIAGPVHRGRVVVTNLGWTVEAARLARTLGLPDVQLVNDLEAMAHGLAELEPADFAVLQEGAPGAEGNRAVIAAGTGLGEAGVYWDGHAHHPFATEGSHTDFGPRSRLEMALLHHCLAKFDRVSYERLVSGSGLFEIYTFLRDSKHGEEPAWLTRALREEAPPAPIVRAALEGQSALCLAAVDLFVSLYGAEAGNLALKVMARGGVFLGGGIAPRILARLNGPVFLDAFLAKGRMRPLLEAMPVRVVLNDQAGLLGAARCAARAAA